MRVGDGDAVGAQDIEETLDFVLVGVGRAALEQPGAAVGGKADPVRDPGEQGENGAGEGATQDVAVVVFTGAEEFRGTEEAGGKSRGALPFARQARGVVEEFVLVGTECERVAGDRFAEDVDLGVGEGAAQIAQGGDGQHSIADEAVADHQDAQGPLIGIGHGRSVSRRGRSGQRPPGRPRSPGGSAGRRADPHRPARPSLPPGPRRPRWSR